MQSTLISSCASRVSLRSCSNLYQQQIPSLDRTRPTKPSRLLHLVICSLTTFKSSYPRMRFTWLTVKWLLSLLLESKRTSSCGINNSALSVNNVLRFIHPTEPPCWLWEFHNPEADGLAYDPIRFPREASLSPPIDRRYTFSDHPGYHHC